MVLRTINIRGQFTTGTHMKLMKIIRPGDITLLQLVL